MGNGFSVETENLDRLAKSFDHGSERLKAAGNGSGAGSRSGNSPFGQGQAGASAAEAYTAAREQMRESCQQLAKLSEQTRDMFRAGSKLYASVEDSNAIAARSFSHGA